jgi:N-methylhydantoinase A
VTHELGIDVGGTFTDFVAIDERGDVSVFKCLTTPADPSIGVLEGARVFADEDRRPVAEASRLVHGTTLVTNSLIERRGATLALVTTAGFRDVLEIGREARYDLYDLNLERPEPLVPRTHRLEVEERVTGSGDILIPLEADAVDRLVNELRQLDVESIAVALVNAYVNPAHEELLADALAKRLPGVDVSLSSGVAPVWREYERTSTVVANAYVRPRVRNYLERLEGGFADLGAPDKLYVLMSQGGVTSASLAAEYPIHLVESGPAGGVMAAAFFGRRSGVSNLIAFDMGGTTTKASLVENGSPLRVSEFEVARVARFKKGSGLPLLVPTLELIEIGAGGGSIGRTDSLGLLKVGPRSAGADPGPACYGLGGTEPTVTDADLHLGLLNPNFFLGGAMSLDLDAAATALERLGLALRMDVEACARGIFEVLNEQTSAALRTHIVERAHDPRQFSLVASGGAGPVHAYEIARRLGITEIICPPAAGVASALGFLVSPFSVELKRTIPGRLGAIDWPAIEGRLAELRLQAHTLLTRAGAPDSEITTQRSVDMRYAGQGYEVEVPLPDGPLKDQIEERLRADFDEAYRTRFGFHLETASAEALHWRVAATVTGRDPTLKFRVAADGDPVKGEREAYFTEAGGRVVATVYDRYKLGAGARLEGPCLIEERESTIVVGPSGALDVDEQGNVHIRIGATS